MAVLYPTKLCGPKARIGVSQPLYLLIGGISLLGYLVLEVMGVMVCGGLGWVMAFMATQRNPFMGETLMAWLRLRSKYALNPTRGTYGA